MRHALALAAKMEFSIFHFVEKASKNEVQEFELQNINGSFVTIGYNKSNNKFLSFKAQWDFYNQQLRNYIARSGKPDLVHLHIPWKAGLVVRYWLKKYKIPYVVSEHYGIYNQHTTDNFFKKSVFVKKYIAKIFQSASQVITVSKSLGEEIKLIFKVNYKTISNVVDTSNFYFENITVKDEFSFLHISNMYEIKNTNKIIEAFAMAYEKDNSLRLKLVGATPNNIIAQILNLACKKAITIIGEIPYKEVSELMKQHHAFVLFSDWETQSCVTLEALCTGRPVITSAVGGVQELITPQNGLLVAAGNIKKLASVMLNMKNNFHEYNLEQIAADAQKKYSYNQVANQFMETYKEVLTR